DHADWADARFELTAADSKRPRIHYPRITGGSPQKPFLFRIPATGDALQFEAKGLPPGLALDPATGIVRGALAAPGRSEVAVTVRNAEGADTRTLTIVSAPDAVALTPPMGWNSWNCWALAVDDAKVRAAADAFVQ